MATARPAKLYSPELLGLATGLSQFPLDPALPLLAVARSRTCGSVIRLGLALDGDTRITRIGMQVSACAIGQASAMVLANSAEGARASDVARASNALDGWVLGEGELPDWPGLAALIPARDHPGRHAALLLPWKAACIALSSGTAGG